MAITGLNFTKLSVDKTQPVKAPLKINSGLSVKKLEKADIPDAKGDLTLRFDFEYNLKYDPKIAEMIIQGNVLYTGKEKEMQAILKEWKKNKKVDPNLVKAVINVALVRCNMKAIMLAEQVSLPPHIRFQTISSKKGKSSYIG